MKMRDRNVELGASMVEAALVIGLLVTLVFGTIEVSRYFIIKADLNRAARAGLELAIRHDDLLIDNRDEDYNSSFSEKKDRLLSAANQIERQAMESMPTGYDLHYGANGVLQLIEGSPSDRLADQRVLILRPGEGGAFINENVQIGDPNTYAGNVSLVQHPTLVSRDEATTMVELLRRHPIYVVNQVRMRPIIPFLPDIIVRGEALGMAEIPPIGIEAVPGDPDFVPPSCGDGVYTPGAEHCDREGSVHKGYQFYDKHYCTANCQKRNRCGNGKKETNGNYSEECDGNDGVTECVNKCNSSCKLVPLDPCENGCLETDNPNECDRDIDSTLAENQACLFRESTNFCGNHFLPECDGEIKIVPCEVDPRFECFKCVGKEYGTCNDGVLGYDEEGNLETCDGALVRPGSGVTLPGIPDQWYCRNCEMVVDRCGNGQLDTISAQYSETCDDSATGLVSTRPIEIDEYCDSSDCQIKPKCGNGKINPEAGEQCDPEKGSNQGLSDTQLADGYFCKPDCTLGQAPCITEQRCPDGSIPDWYPARDEDGKPVQPEPGKPAPGQCKCEYGLPG